MANSRCINVVRLMLRPTGPAIRHAPTAVVSGDAAPDRHLVGEFQKEKWKHSVVSLRWFLPSLRSMVYGRHIRLSSEHASQRLHLVPLARMGVTVRRSRLVWTKSNVSRHRACLPRIKPQRRSLAYWSCSESRRRVLSCSSQSSRGSAPGSTS